MAWLNSFQRSALGSFRRSPLGVFGSARPPLKVTVAGGDSVTVTVTVLIERSTDGGSSWSPFSPSSLLLANEAPAHLMRFLDHGSVAPGVFSSGFAFPIESAGFSEISEADTSDSHPGWSAGAGAAFTGFWGVPDSVDDQTCVNTEAGSRIVDIRGFFYLHRAEDSGGTPQDAIIWLADLGADYDTSSRFRVTTSFEIGEA